MAREKTNNTTSNNIECTNWITPNMYEIAEINGENLLVQYGITQLELAEKTGFAPAAVSNYIHCKRSGHFPSLSFLCALQQLFGISIDEYISKEIAPTQFTPPVPTNFESKELKAYNAYCGLYYCHYFDTSKYKGRDYNSDEEALLYGIIAIFKDSTVKETMGHSCFAVMGFNTADSAKKAMAEFKERFNENNISELYKFIDSVPSYENRFYYGDFELNSTSAFLSLTHRDKDKALIILHRVPSKSPTYSGGIGTINSVSRGREPMPVVQFIGLSREFLDLPVEEIHHNLQLNYPSFKAREATSNLIKKFKDLYLSSGNQYDSYSDFDKELVLSGNIEFVLKELLKKNLFRYGKISNRDDDDWYHFIKDYLKEVNSTDVVTIE